MPLGNMTKDEAQAINRFAVENNYRLGMSMYPVYRFQDKTTGEYIEKDITDLLHDHAVKKLEEQKSRKSEKQREEREAKWKPRIVE